MLNELKTHHRKICQLTFEGYKTNEVAEKLNIAISTVQAVLRSPLSKSYINGLADRVEETTLDVRQKLIRMNEKALTAIENMLSEDTIAPPAVQLNAAKDILDRNGYKAPDKHEVDLNYQTKSDEEIDAEIARFESDIKRTYNSDLDVSEDQEDLPASSSEDSK